MGYDGVELRGAAGEHLGPDEPPADLAALKQECESAGVEVASIMAYTNFASHVEETRRGSIETTAKYVEVARQIDCPVVRIFGGVFEDELEKARGRVIEALKEVCPVAEKAGVKLCIETHDHWLTAKDLRPVIDGVGSPALAVCWDAANSFFKEDPDESWKGFGSLVEHVHFKDVKLVEGEKHRAIMPGEGDVDHEKILSALHRGGYSGYISFEWEKKWQAHLEEPEVAFPQFATYMTGLMSKLNIPRG